MKTFKLWAAALTVLCGTTPSPASSVSVHYSNSVNADLVSATSTPTGDSPQISISLPVLRSQATASPEEILNRLNNEIARLTNSHDEEFDKLNPGEMEIAQSDNDRIVIRAKVSSEFDNNNKDDKQVRPARTIPIYKLYVSYDRRTSKVDIVSRENDAVIEYYPHVLRKNLEELTQGMGNDQLWFEQTFFIATEMNRVHEEQHQKDIRSHKEVGYDFPKEVNDYLAKNEATLSKQRNDEVFYNCLAIMEARSMAEEARKLFMILSGLAGQKDKDDNEMVPGLFNIKGKEFSLTYGQLREKINNKKLKQIVINFVAARKGDLKKRINGYAVAFRTYYNEKNDVWSDVDNTDKLLEESVNQLAKIDKEMYKKYMEKMDFKEYHVTKNTEGITGETIFVKKATESLEKIFVIDVKNLGIEERYEIEELKEYLNKANNELEIIEKCIGKMDENQKSTFAKTLKSYMLIYGKKGTQYRNVMEACKENNVDILACYSERFEKMMNMVGLQRNDNPYEKLRRFLGK